jgi:hypothetical protein
MGFRTSDIPALTGKASSKGGGQAGSKGKALESVIWHSQGNVVRLTRVEQAARVGRDADGDPITIRQRGPCDFFGAYVFAGRMLVLDAKECGNKCRFLAGRKYVPDHQFEQLVRYGEVGAVAGLVAHESRTGTLFWVDWRLLAKGHKSFVWSDLPAVGRMATGVSWVRVELASADAVTWRPAEPAGGNGQ